MAFTGNPMNDDFQITEISPSELKTWLKDGQPILVLDVREPMEFSWAALRLPQVHFVPLSELEHKGLEALPAEAREPSARVVVMCHMGERSAMVTDWLRSQGWQNTFNLSGGIDAYAHEIDPSIGFY